MILSIDRAQADTLCKGMVIPPKPEVLLAIERARNSDDPDFEHISRLISSDMSLSASVLKTVNSPMCRRGQRIASVSQAMQLMGLSSVCNVVQAMLLARSMQPAPGQAEFMAAFWANSQAVAMICAYLSGSIRSVAKEEAYTYGLFQKCGQALMATRFSDYAKVRQEHEHAALTVCQQVEDEMQRYQTSHNVVGHLLARTWFLPEQLGCAILNQHNLALFDQPADGLETQACNLIALGALAEHIHARFIGRPISAHWPALAEYWLTQLKVGHNEFADLIDEAHELLSLS